MEKLAADTRARLGIDVSMQLRWTSPYDAFNNWRTAFERIGLLVCQLEGVDVEEVRGFSIAEIPFPTVVVNSKDHPHGRVFTLFHEYCHLLLNQVGLCDLLEGPSFRSHDQKVERFCNSFAAAALLPADDLLKAAGLSRSSRRSDWSLADLANLADCFRVSREAIIRRFVSLGITPFGVYLATREKLRVEHAQDMRDNPPSTGRLPSPGIRAVRRAGPLFVRIIFDAYDREEITISDVAEYLGVRTKHFPKVLERVRNQPTEVVAGT